MPVDRAKLKEHIAKMSAEDRAALAEELGVNEKASVADILKALEGIDDRLKKLETPDPPKKDDSKPFGGLFDIF